MGIGPKFFEMKKFNKIDNVKKTKQIFHFLSEDLKNFNIRYEDIIKVNVLDKKKILEKRLEIIFYNEMNLVQSYKDKLILKINCFVDFLKKLKKI